MRGKAAYSSWSLAAASSAVMIAQAYHPALTAANPAGETAAWLAMLVACLIAILLFWPVALRLSHLRRGNLIDLAAMAAGIPGTLVTAGLVSGLVIFHGGLVIRQTAEMTVTSIYPHTPQTFLMVVLTACTTYGAWGGTAGLVRLAKAFLPLLALSILGVLLGVAGWVRVRYLLPFWGPGPLPLVGRSTLLAAVFSPLALFLLLACGEVRDRRRLCLAGTVALGGSGLIMVAAKVVLGSLYPLPLALMVTYPMHQAARLVIGGRFFERVEGVWVVIWFFATACHLSALVHAAGLALSGAFGLPSHRPAVLPLVTMAATVALFPPDQSLSIAWHQAAAPVTLAIGFGLPLLLTLLAARQRRGSSHAA